MKQKNYESFKLPVTVMDYARAHKKVTGVAMSTFIEEAFNKQLNKLPKKVKEKMQAVDPSLVF